MPDAPGSIVSCTDDVGSTCVSNCNGKEKIFKVSSVICEGFVFQSATVHVRRMSDKSHLWPFGIYCTYTLQRLITYIKLRSLILLRSSIQALTGYV